MGLILLRDLQYRRWRVLLTVVLMSIVMTLLFLMSGLVGQFNAEPELATTIIGDDHHWVVPAGSGGPLTNPTGFPRPEFPAIPGGESVILGASLLGDERVFVAGRDYRPGSTLDRSLTAGRLPGGPGEVVVDETTGFDVGETLALGATPSTVVGTVTDATVLAGLPIAFTTADYGQTVVAANRDIAMAVLTPEADPQVPGEFRVFSPDAVVDDTLVPLQDAISSVALVQALLWLITTIVIAAIVYITALERTRDFAVLKAVGGKTRELAGSLLVQGVIMTILAVGIAAAIQSFVAPLFPMIIRVPASSWWQIPIGAVIVAVVAGMAGVSKVRSTSPVEAFG